MTLTLNYVSFIVSDMDRALAFYRTLGLPIPEDADPTEDHVEVRVGALRIAWETEALMRRVNPAWTRPERAGRVGVALEADSPAGVDAAVARLKAAGYAVAAEPYDAFWGQRYATVTDPDGTPVDVFAALPGAQGG